MSDMTDYISDEYLREFEMAYQKASEQGAPSDDITFKYAWSLIRSQLIADNKNGVRLMTDLLKKSSPDDTTRRDYYYFLAVGHAKMKDYKLALKYIDDLLALEPGNRQAHVLQKAIRKKMETDAMKGAAVAGGGILLAGGLVALGLALLKN